MGLDISAYEKVTLVHPTNAYNEEYELPNHRFLYQSPGFIAQADGLVTGHYKVEGEEIHFRAGSYSGYNHWRNTLSLMLGKPAEEVWENPVPGPIHFSDCEGIIGPKTSAKLAKDFAEWEEKAAIFFNAQPEYQYPDWIISKYNDFHKAFVLASNGGVVIFS
jgi:hypothetical protein